MHFVSFKQIFLEDITYVHHGYVHTDVVEKGKILAPDGNRTPVSRLSIPQHSCYTD
jgi:hypothetical protein